jgi:hypothetical protein
MWQKAGEIQAYRAYEKGVEKWWKEHIPRKGKGNISTEGQELLEDKEIWGTETVLHGAVYESRKRERSNEDGLSRTVGRMDEVDLGQITRPKENAPDNSHTFPTNAWIHKITKGKGSDRCNLWAAHIDVHHKCWRLIHRELAQLAAPQWKFLCVSGEKCLQTIWDDITSEFKDIPYLNLKQRGYSKGDSREGKFLADAVGRNISPPTRGQCGRDLLYFGT